MKLVEIVRGKTRAYRLVFEPAPGGDGYVVTCPVLPSMVTEGETMKEALGMAHHAIERCLQILAARGQEVPEGEVLFAGDVPRSRSDHRASFRSQNTTAHRAPWQRAQFLSL